MPKGRSRKKQEKFTIPVDSASPDEDSESVCSSLDGCSVQSEEGLGEDGKAEEDFEFLLAGLVDELTEKNSRVRMEALARLNKILSNKVVTDGLIGRKDTILELILRGLKKAQGTERCGLAKLSMLLVLQLGLEYPDLQASIHPLAIQLAQDHTISSQERVEVIVMLGVTTFVQAADILEVEHTMRALEDLIKKCKDVLVVSAAVRSWTLLLSIAPSHSTPTLFTSLLPVLNQLLESGELSVRLAVGVGVAILFELARDHCSESEVLLDSAESTNTYSVIEQLATESNRHTTRKDRNHTRSCFRDISLSLDGGGVPERSVKVGTEVLPLDSWARLCQYDTFKDLLGSGLTIHLKHNEMLRDIFHLGPIVVVPTVETKAARLEKKYWNAAVAKSRTQSRGKQRDKRAVL